MNFRKPEDETPKTAVENLAMFLGFHLQDMSSEQFYCFVDSVVILGIKAGLTREDFNCFDTCQETVNTAWKRYTYPDRVPPMNGILVDILYKNHKWETAWRTIQPQSLWYGFTKWHPENQWFIKGIDVAKRVERDFAWKDVQETRQPRTDAKGHILFHRKDDYIPQSIQDGNGDIVLAMCKVCGAGEIELEQPCTGRRPIKE